MWLPVAIIQIEVLKQIIEIRTASTPGNGEIYLFPVCVSFACFFPPPLVFVLFCLVLICRLCFEMHISKWDGTEVGWVQKNSNGCRSNIYWHPICSRHIGHHTVCCTCWIQPFHQNGITLHICQSELHGGNAWMQIEWPDWARPWKAHLTEDCRVIIVLRGK